MEKKSSMKRRWYEKYEELNSAMFTWENSGQRLGSAPPYRSRRDEHFNTTDIYGEFGLDKMYKIVGYTENPPFDANGYPSVAIMFEEQTEFFKIWWHYERD